MNKHLNKSTVYIQVLKTKIKLKHTANQARQDTKRMKEGEEEKAERRAQQTVLKVCHQNEFNLLTISFSSSHTHTVESLLVPLISSFPQQQNRKEFQLIQIRTV